MVVILQKMIMTGAMCVVAQGSSLQLLIAILVMLLFTLLVLKTAPYLEDSEDSSSFIASFALTLTTIGGFALITDDPTTRTYESKVLAVVLIGINVICIAVDILIVVVFDCGLFGCWKTRDAVAGGGAVAGDGARRGGGSGSVLPAPMTAPTNKKKSTKKKSTKKQSKNKSKVVPMDSNALGWSL